MNRAVSLVALLLLLALCSCRVGPNYSRPTVTLPDQYRSWRRRSPTRMQPLHSAR